MRFNQILGIICLLAFQVSKAAVTGVSINGDTVSNQLTTTTSATDTTPANTDYVIFGGYSGAIGGCSTGSAPQATSVCDACSTSLNLCPGGGGTGIYQCAQRSIHPNLLLTIGVTLGELPTNPHLAVQWTGTSDRDLTSLVINAPTSFSANSQFTIQLPWSAVCSAAGLNANCEGTGSTGATGSLLVGLTDGGTTLATGNYQKFTVRLHYVDPTDANSMVPNPKEPTTGEPFTDFEVLPGDEKVYINDIKRGSFATPDSSGTKWDAIRVYYGVYNPPTTPSSPDFCGIPLQSNFSDLKVQDKTTLDTGLSDGKVTGLTNDENYMFNIASVDEATIVTGFINPANMTTLPDKTRYVGQPGEVVGLLSNKGCFIATAAYGSQMAPQVELLRQFRNEFLLTNTLGRGFVRTYYKYSPPIADFIADHDGIRALIRGALWPLILFADLSLKIGFFMTFGLFTLALMSLILMARQVRRSV